MKACPLFVAAVMLVLAGCGRSPVAPDQQRPPVASSTLSGQVHENVVWGDPPLANARIDVTGADGLQETGVSDDRGFYKIAAAPGRVAVTASKPGFATKTSQFLLVTDTVLNFSLTPD